MQSLRTLACALAVSSLAITPAALGAELAIEPSSGPAGSTATVTATDFSNAGLTIEVHWGAWDGPILATEVTRDTAGFSGFTTEITVPEDAAPGAYDVVACAAGMAGDCLDTSSDLHEGASTTFTVTTPSGLRQVPRIIPGGPNGLYGPYSGPVNGLTPVPLIPRCAPPAGASVFDFDTDDPGTFPRTAGVAAVAGFHQAVDVAPAGSISPRQALHLASPSPSGYLVATFAEPQRYVGLHVGDADESGGRITLLAEDSAGNVVAADRIESAHAPADVCMAAAADEATIVRVVVQFDAGPSLYVDRFYFDDDEFPAPPLRARGSVEFQLPTDGDEVSNRTGQLVFGVIRVPEAFTIDEVVLSVPSWDRSRATHRSIEPYPRFVEGGERLYWFAAGRVYVPEGESWMTVTATGPGVIATGGIVVVGVGATPLPEEDVAGRVDIEPVTIEVTQAVRGVVDLIPPGTTIRERRDAVLVQNKKTVVRGFARLTFPDGCTFRESVPVNAELVGARKGEALPGSPLTPVRPTLEVRAWGDRARSYHANKQRTDLSWNFLLPDSWTDAGTIDLRLEVNSALLAGHIDEHPSGRESRNRIGLGGVRFRRRNPHNLNLWRVDYYYKCRAPGDTRPLPAINTGSTSAETVCAGRPAGTVVHAQPTPTQAAIAVLEAWNVAPLPGPAPARWDLWEYTARRDGVTRAELAPGAEVTPGSPRSRFWLDLALRQDLIVGVNGYTTFNGLMTSFVRGKAFGVPSFFRFNPLKLNFLHELGHTTGLRHSGSGHGEDFSISRWRGDHGWVARSREVVSAFDTANMEVVPFEGLHDLMSYGGRRWPSPEVWTHLDDAVSAGVARADHRLATLLDRPFEGHRASLEPVPAQSGLGFGPALAVLSSSIRSLSRPHAAAALLGGLDGGPTSGGPAGDPDVIVLGSLGDSGVELGPVFHRESGGLISEDGEVLLQVLAADGAVLSESRGPLLEGADDPGGPQAFSVPLAVPHGAAELVVSVEGREMLRREIPPPPSGVTPPMTTSGVAAPGTLELGTDPVELAWSARGADRHLLEVSRDGRQWYTIAVTDEPRATVDPSTLPFQGPGWMMRVQSSSGIALALSPVVPVELGLRRTPPMILLPVDGSVVSSNTLIRLHAAVSQFSLGEEKRYAWSIDGTKVAEGPTGLTFAGDPGAHRVMLRSPDSGLETAATITVVADSDLDGASDAWETEWGLDPNDPADAATDADGDGVAASSEFRHGSSPESIDTDGDDYSDGVEIAIGTDPNDPDSYPGVGFDGKPVPRLSGTAPAGTSSTGGGFDPVEIGLAVLLVALVLAGGFLWLRRHG